MRRLARVIVVAALVWSAAPGSAWGGGSWPWPVQGSVALPYGAAYRNGAGASCTHGGLDLAVPAGSGVSACCGGAVSFAGRVPAGEGHQAYAVTVSCADGLRVTYLPLREVRVHKGQSVEAGDLLGCLDGEGDASSPASHLHLGVRRGEAQLDPEGFLAAPAAAGPGPEPEPQTARGPAPAPARAGSPADAPAISAGASAPAIGAQSLAHVGAGSPAAASAPAVGGSPVSAGTPVVDGRQAVRDAARIAADAMTGGPEIARISALADAPTLDAGRMLSDVGTGRGILGGLLLRVGLAIAGAACIVPVVRGARRAAAAQLPASLEPARRPAR